ncbi:MAG: 4Fe-4S ferredoxin, partial [Desulfobacterales bacterium]
MKIVQIDKKKWEDGIGKLSDSYRLFGPVKEADFHNFKQLEPGQVPDLSCLNTRLSPKSVIYPQTEVMFQYSLDENEADHHILKEVDKDYNPRAVIGIRPCDAKAFELVRLNFDTADYKDPYWINAYEATTLVGLACESPCRTCFCTSAGCGPYHEEALDLLLIDNGDQYWTKVITDKGDAFLAAAGWTDTVDEKSALKPIEDKKKTAEDK